MDTWPIEVDQFFITVTVPIRGVTVMKIRSRVVFGEAYPNLIAGRRDIGKIYNNSIKASLVVRVFPKWLVISWPPVLP